MSAPAARPEGNRPLVFVADLQHPELDDHDRHHLTRSLRLRPGDPLVASDGRGSWRPCRLTEEGLESDGAVSLVAVPQPALTVGFALIKQGKPELVVQKLTELGVDVIVPFVSERSVVRWEGERAAKQVQRLRRVSREAAMQSRRVRLPHVAETSTFAELAATPGAVRAEQTGDPLTLATATVLVGPEGGWSDAERQRLGSVRLGDGVLRAETAAIAAGVLLAALRDHVVRPAGTTP